MHKPSSTVRLDIVILGALAALAGTSPALAAPPFDVPFTAGGLPLRDWLLMGSLSLLAIAIALRLFRNRASTEPAAEGPDLRWWRN